MSRYMITYLGMPESANADENKRHMMKYREWLNSLGDSAVSPMNPLKNSSTVNPDGSVTNRSTTSMSGFTIIEADSMDSAMSVARACPFLEIGGSLEVSEVIEIPG